MPKAAVARPTTPTTIGKVDEARHRPPGGYSIVATGLGYTASGLEGRSYTDEACHARAVTFDGLANVAPDPRCTPGAIDTAVTQANLDQTVCRPGGYSASVRAPESVTEPAKHQAMTAYGYTDSAALYEFDHLISLELGGSNDTSNLWPELDIGGTGGFIINAKDQVEDDLHAAVCSGRIRLPAAQAAIARNWTTAASTIGGDHVAPGTDRADPSPPPPPVTAPATPPGALVTPSGHLYRAGEFCPDRDLGMTTEGSAGRLRCAGTGRQPKWVTG